MNEFQFKKNIGVQALAETNRSVKVIKPLLEEPNRSKHVSAYLTDEEYKTLQTKLDGRPASSVVRKLILTYIDHE
jgi:hypothetical protein